MAETVDTRVVEAKFDSSQFEKGVNKTVKKLDELKQSLNLESAGKSVAQIGDKISDSTKKASDSLEKLENRFTSFFGMIKQKFISGIADEIVGVFFNIKHSFENLVTSLSSAQISRGMQRYNDILNSVRTLVSAGVEQGAAYEAIERLGEYADQTSYSLDSMVATMSKFKTAGADLGTAARMIEGLSNAAASMGVNAQQAERAYLNLQQAYSKKVMLQNDWMSFESIPMVGEKFNQKILDAAVKVGTLQADKIDKETGEILSYKTKKKAGTKIKSAKGITANNMSSNLASRWFTDEVMEEVFGNTYYFAEVGIDEVNELKKIEKRLKSQIGTIDEETGKKRDKAWFDEEFQKELDTKALERREEKIEELNKSLAEAKITQEEYNKALADFDKSNTMTVFGYEAFRAGQEARSFADVLNTLKDAISRGWATSFELIFGQLDEAAEFFTSLTESNFAEAIYKIGEFRNAVLQSWNAAGGRNTLLGLLEYIDDLVGSINEKFGLIRDAEEWFNMNFNQELYNQILHGEGKEQAEAYKQSIKDESEKSPMLRAAEELGQRLMILSVDIKEFFRSVNLWFTEADSTGTSRLQRIQTIIEGFGKIVSGVFTAIGLGVQFVGKIYNAFKGAFDELWKAIEKVATPIFNLFDPKAVREDGLRPYKMLEDTLNNIGKVAEKVAGPIAKIIEIVGDVANFFIDMAISSFLSNMQFFTDAFGLLLEIIGIGSSQQDNGAGVLNGITDAIQRFGDTCKNAFQAVGDFFSSLISDLRTILGLDNGVRRRSAGGSGNGGLFANLQNFFANNQFLKDAKKWIGDAFDKVFNYIQSLPSRAFDLAMKLPSIIEEFLNGLFYTKKLQTSYGPNGLESKYIDVETPLKQWLDKAILDVSAFIKSIPDKLKKIPSMIYEFFKGIFYKKKLVTSYGPKGLQSKYVDVKTPLKEWIDNAIKDVKAFIKDIPNKLAKIPSIIGEFFKSIFYKQELQVSYGANGLESKYVDVETPFKEWIDKVLLDLKNFFGHIDLSGLLTSIQNVGVSIANGFISIFSGETDWNLNKEWISQKIANMIDDIRVKAEAFWPKAKKWLEDIPKNITKLFTDENPDNEGSAVGTALRNFGSSVAVMISDLPNVLLKAWQDAEGLMGTLWESILNGILGRSNKPIRMGNTQLDYYYQLLAKDAKEGTNEANKYLQDIQFENFKEDSPIAYNIQSFFTNLLTYLGGKITAIPGQIASTIGQIGDIVIIIWDAIRGENVDANGTIKDYGNPLYNTIASIADSVVGWARDEIGKISDRIKKGWGTAVDIAKIIGDVLFGSNVKPIFNQEAYNKLLGTDGRGTAAAEAYRNATKDYGSTLYNNIATIFTNIKTWVSDRLKDLKGDIEKAWGAVKTIGGIIWDILSGNATDGNGELKDYGDYDKFAEIFNGIVEWAKDELIKLPKRITAGFNFAKELIHNLLNPDTTADDIINASVGGVNDAIRNSSFGLSTMGSVLDSALKATEGIDKNKLKKSNFFTELWDAFVAMFEDIGPAILEGLNKAFEWIGKGLTHATDFLKNLHTEGKTIKDVIFGDEKDIVKGEDGKEVVNPIFETVKSIGQHIYDLITKVIPEFITTAAQDLWAMIPNIINRITGKDDGAKSNIAEVVGEEAMSSLGLNLGGLRRSVSKDEKDAKEIVDRKQQIAKEVEEIDKLNKEIATLDPIANAQEYTEKKAQLNIHQRSKELLEKLTADSIDLVDVYRTVYNEYKLEADKLRKQIEDDEAELRELEGAKAGGSTHSPEYDEYIKNRKPEIEIYKRNLAVYDAELGMLQKYDNEGVQIKSADEDGFLGGIKEIVEGFKGFLKGISENDTLKIIAIVAVIAYLLRIVRDIIDNVQFIDDIGFTAKWVGIGAVMTALATIIGYMTILSANAEEGTKDAERLKRVKETLKEFGDWIKDILNLVTWIVGLLSLKEGLGALHEWLENKNEDGEKESKETTKEMNTFLQWISKPLESFLGGFSESSGKTLGKVTTTYLTGGMIGDLIEMLSGNLNDTLEQLGSGFELFTQYLGKTVENINAMKKETNGVPAILSAIETVTDIANLIQRLLKLLDVFNYDVEEAIEDEKTPQTQKTVDLKVKGDNILQLVDILAKIMSKLSGGLSLLKNAVSGYGNDVSVVVKAIGDLIQLTEQMKTFTEFAKTGDFITFKNALASFGAISSLFADSIGKTFSEKPKDLNIQNMIDMISMLFGDEKFKSLIQAFTKEDLPDLNGDVLNKAEKIIIFSSALSSLAKVGASFTGNEKENIQKLIEAVTGIEFKDKTDGSKVSTFVVNMGELANGIGTFAMETSGLTEDIVSNSERALTMLLRIGQGLGSLPSTSFWANMINGDQSLGTFGINIAELGNNLAKFYGAVAYLQDTSGNILKDTQGNPLSITKDVLDNALLTADYLTRFAVRLGDTGGRFTGFSQFMKIQASDYTQLAKNLVAFMSAILIPIDEAGNTLERFNEDDFSYLGNVLDFIDYVTRIMARIDNMKLENLGTGVGTEGTLNNKLTPYISSMFLSMNSFATNVVNNAENLTNISKYRTDLFNYVQTLKEIIELVASANSKVLGSEKQHPDDVIMGWNTVVEGIFGTYDTIKDAEGNVISKTHTQGILDNLADFINHVTELTEGTEGEKKSSITVFGYISEIVSSYASAIASMADAEKISNLYGHVNSDFGSYVSQLGGVLQEILNQRAVFEEFFEWGGQFNTGYVQNIALMMSALKDIVGFTTDMSQGLGFTENTLANLRVAHWSELFSIIQDIIIGDNKDFFSPKITPVLEITPEFEQNAAHLRELLGLSEITDSDTGKVKYQFDLGNLANGVNLTMPEYKDYSGQLDQICGKIDQLSSISQSFEDALSRTSFVIPAERLTEVIGPSMDKWLGSEATFIVRATVNN